jgi:hypothetical protein
MPSGMTESEIADYVEDLAATMLASTLGIEFDPDAAWDERKRVYEMSDLIVDSLSVTAAAEGAPKGDWTCAVAAAVFRFEIFTPGPYRMVQIGIRSPVTREVHDWTVARGVVMITAQDAHERGPAAIAGRIREVVGDAWCFCHRCGRAWMISLGMAPIELLMRAMMRICRD